MADQLTTYLLLVLYHRTVTFLALSACTCDDRTVRDRNVKASSQNPVDTRDRVRDVVSLSFPRATGDVDINALVVRAWHDAQRCT